MINNYKLEYYDFKQKQLKYSEEKMSYEDILNDINNISLEILRQNENICFSQEQWDTLKLVQEICGGRKTINLIYVIPTGDKPIKIAFEA